MKPFFFFTGLISLIASTVTIIVISIQLDQDCTGHLKRAADANTIEIAKQEIDVAVNYLEANELTTGYTSIFYRTPDEDIEFWYNNLKAAQLELATVSDSATQLERSNILIKLRETLIDHTGKSGDKITCPDGLSRYPNNGLFALWLNLSWILMAGAATAFIVEDL